MDREYHLQDTSETDCRFYGYGSSGEYKRVQQRLRDQQCVVKSVGNGDWPLLVAKMKEGSASRTPTSMLPPNGKNMKLYGSERYFTAGIMFDCSEVDFTEEGCWCWPSGYYAKTEFNVGSHGELLNGRKQKLVSIDTLREQNRSYLLPRFEWKGKEVSSFVVPFNEIHVCPNKAPPLAIFSRTRYGYEICEQLSSSK